MAVDRETVKRVARLARIKVTEEEAAALEGELNGILGWVEQLSEVDVAGVEPMTSVTPMRMKKRPDQVTEGDRAADIFSNAPASQDGYFVVPKVVE
jgi:aspartyl-tRNA(Asn)/glutamyl-tRNA(Gln) amidotransferase subunit C